MSKSLGAVAATALLAVVIPASSAMAAGGTTATTGGADIQISGSASGGSPVQGQPYSYTFQIKNSGPSYDPSIVFTDDMTAGHLNYVQGLWNGYIPVPCSSTSDGNGGTLATCTSGLTKADFLTVTMSVTAPLTIGTFADTGTATASLTDPNLSNNSVTVNVKVGSAACPLPAGQPTTTGVVGGKSYDANGYLSSFQLMGSDVTNYTVIMNLFTAPLTSTINLLCKVVPPNLYIQPTTTDNVTGPVDMEILPGDSVASPVIHALVVQTPYWVDKIA